MWKTAWITSTGLRRAALLLTLTCSTAAAQSIAIDRFTIQPPEIAFQGERYLITARLTVTDRPEGSSTGFIARYIGANIADTVSVGTSGGTLRSIEIRIPRRTCFPSLCADPGPTTVAESLTEVPDRVDLIPVILDAQGGTLASGAATQVPVSKTGDVTITPSSQPLQARQRVRVTMENANFTAGGATVFFRDTRDPRGNDPIQTINWSAPSNRRPVCGNMEPLRQVVSCAPEIINDTTFEFTIDAFLLMGDVARYDGRTFDIIASSAAGANVALNAWRFGGQTTAPLPPVMSSISPSNAVIGGPGFTLTVDGSDFAPDAVLLWDLVRLNPRTVTPTKLTADIPASLLQPDPAVAASAKLPRLAVDGGKEVEVRVENPGLSEGAKQVSNALKFFLAPPKEVNRDVIVRNMEIVQSVQTPSNTVPLAAGKRTVVRVYLGLTEGSTPTGEFVDVTLAAFRNREPVPGQPTVIRRSVRPLRFGEEPNRNRISSSAVFELPLSWTEPGSITLAATAHPDDPEAFPNENTANNEFREGFTFAARSSLTVNYYRVCETIKGQLEQRCPDERRISNPSNLDFVQKTFPIPERGLQYGAAGAALSFGSVFYHQIDLEIETIWIDKDVRRELLFKVLAAKRLPGVVASEVSIFWRPPTGNVPSSGRILPLDQELDSFLLHDNASTFLLNTFLMGVPVVLGKALGRTNIGCEVIRNTIGDEEGVGFDVAEKQVKDSEWSWDFSNGGELRCPSRLLWISPSSVEQMFNSEKIQPDAGARLSPERQQNAGPAVFVSGSFRKDGTSATLDPVFLLPAGSLLDEVPTSGTYCAVFEGQGGTIAQYCPDLAFTLPDGFADEPGETELEENIFGFAVAVPSGATKVALTFDGAELTSRTASANPPTVVFTDPQPGGRWDGGMQTIAWSGADADGDALSYMLLASRDGAEDWTLLDSRLTREDFDVNADLANGGPNVYFCVLASDGLQTAEATVGPIDVVQRPAISVIPEAIDIGPVVAGFDHQQGFVLINEGSGSLNVNAIESDNPVFQVLAPETPFDIPAQAAARVTLRYAPTSVGLEAAVLTVRSNATNQPELKINISANAVEATTPTIRVSEQSLGFGEVPTGQSLTVPLVISNLSSAELSVEYQLAGGAYSLVDSPASPFVLVGVDQEIIQIRFAPDREGEFAGSLRITSNDPNQPVIDLELAGAGIPPIAVPGPTPSISAGGVVNAASFVAVISPGSWVTIFGQNLAGSTTTWDGAIQGTDLPTVVAGVQVLFDGRPGAVSFVSPGQINVQAPGGVDGQVEVRVIVNGVAGQASIAEVRALAPALFTYGPGQTRHAAAVHLDGVFVGPDDLFGGVVPTRPAQAGDRILVFGSGFGPTNPPVPAGLLFLGAARLTNSVRVLIGSGEAVVEFAGLSGAGLNQFNVIVPDGLPSGDHEIVIEVGSQQTQPGVRLSVTGSVGGPGSGPIEIQLLDAELTSPEVGLLSYSWSAAFSDTRARSLRIDVVLSVDEQIGGTDVVLLSENRETRQGQSGLGVQDVAIVPQDVPDDDYFIGILITDLGSGEESRSNVLPLEIAR